MPSVEVWGNSVPWGGRGHDVPLAQVTEVHNINNYWSVVSSVGLHSSYKVMEVSAAPLGPVAGDRDK